MWPIVVAIVVCLVGYTYVRLNFAKQQRAHEPYADSQRRVGLAQLEAAGWQHLDIDYTATEAGPAGAAHVAVATTPGLPETIAELRQLTNENWHFPIEYTAVESSAETKRGNPLTVAFTAELDRSRVQIVGFDLFRKDSTVLVLPRWTGLPTTTNQGAPQATGSLAIPTESIPPGTYTLILPALKQSSQWTVEIRDAAN